MDYYEAPEATISPTRFDGAAIWATFSPEKQARIGAAAVELVMGHHLAFAGGYATDSDAVSRAAAQAFALARELIDAEVLGWPDGIPPGEWLEKGPHGAQYRIPSIIGMVCLSCGCSEGDACEGGCGWHDETTCTACVADRPEE
ncbi:hypothetical protein [Methylobacterium sp. J-076]|uniref:hypothetical protein n=1 Tax=Methylobacterium sp. J-076 TaxID=2836655 RepID=UPI001FB9E7F9|nr:hypothetical protein [Methylobacterium sp. J-076]MCJ2015589.1 hypothetical protein [Methylobacterium sp. J-076]